MTDWHGNIMASSWPRSGQLWRDIQSSDVPRVDWGLCWVCITAQPLLLPNPVSFPSAILNKPLAIHLLLSLLPKTNSTYSIHQNTVTKNTDVFQVSSLLWMILNKHQYIHYPTCLHHYLLKDKQKIIYKTLLTVRGQNPVFQPGPRCPEFD